MSIISEINRINTNIANAYTKAEEKGATLPVAQNSANLADTIDSITGGGGGEANIFVQLTEPETKKGIWLQKDAEFDVAYIDDAISEGQWGSATRVPYATGYNNTAWSHLCANVGTNIYIFGGYNNGENRNAYKYDTLTDTYTQLANLPYGVMNTYGRAISLGTDIYINGDYSGATGSKKLLKYDTLTNTYTQLANAPVTIGGATMVAIGTDIYIFGTASSSGNRAQVLKYDTLNNTYSTLTSAGQSIATCPQITALGDEVYILENNSYNNGFKYNVKTGVTTSLTSVPTSGIQGVSSCILGNNIYVFGNSGSPSGLANSVYAYKYDIANNTYTRLTDIPYGNLGQGACLIGDKIWLCGGSNKSSNVGRDVQYLSLSTSQYDDKSVIISQSKKPNIGYNIELFSSSIFKNGYSPEYAITDAYYYTNQNGLDTTIPTYYGDGTNWVKFKN